MARPGAVMAAPTAAAGIGGPLMVAEAVRKYFPLRRGLFGRGAGSYLRGVDGVSFAIPRGSSLGIAGESGCGKTTLARLLLRLLTPTAGRITFAGEDLAEIDGPALLAFRRRAQLMVQNPYEAINPRFTMLATISQ